MSIGKSFFLGKSYYTLIKESNSNLDIVFAKKREDFKELRNFKLIPDSLYDNFMIIL